MDILQKYFKKDHVHMCLWTRFYGIESLGRAVPVLKGLPCIMKTETNKQYGRKNRQIWFLIHHTHTQYLYTIPGVQKKVEWQIFIPCKLKVLYLFTLLDKASSAEENDTMIIKFGWVIWIYADFLQYSNFQISLDFCDERRIVVGKVYHTALWRSPLIRGNKRNTYQ